MCLEEGTTRASPRGGGDTRDSNSLGSGNWEGRGSRGEEGGQARGTASPPRGERRSLLAGPVGELLLSWKEARGSPDFLHRLQLCHSCLLRKIKPGHVAASQRGKTQPQGPRLLPACSGAAGCPRPSPPGPGDPSPAPHPAPVEGSLVSRLGMGTISFNSALPQLIHHAGTEPPPPPLHVFLIPLMAPGLC